MYVETTERKNIRDEERNYEIKVEGPGSAEISERMQSIRVVGEVPESIILRFEKTNFTQQ